MKNKIRYKIRWGELYQAASQILNWIGDQERIENIYDVLSEGQQAGNPLFPAMYAHTRILT